MRTKRILLLLAVAVVVCGAVLGEHFLRNQQTEAEVRPEVGYQAPDFVLADLNGQQVALRDLRGQTVFLNFWALSCGYCVAEMPAIQALQQAQGNKVKIITVNLGDDPAAVQGFMDENGYNFTTLLDRDGAAGSAYWIRSIPATYVIDAQGIIRGVRFGAMDQGMMEKLLAKAQ